MKYIKHPNLPVSCRHVLLGQRYMGRLQKPLEAMGITAIAVPDNPYVDKRLAGHCDLSVCHLGDNNIILAPYLNGSRLQSTLWDLGFKISFLSQTQSEAYPYDCQLNICSAGSNLICNPTVNSMEVLSHFTSSRLIPTKQGYCKCSVCMVTPDAIISSDTGICRSAREKGIDVLEISPGNIVLDGFPYGFIGGSSFKSGENSIVFTGQLDYLPDKEKILEFLRKKSITCHYLTKEPVFDIGSIIPLTEK